MAARPADRRPLGRTGLQVSPVCIGTSPLASMPALYGYEVAADRADATIRATLGGPFNFLDTSVGVSEPSRIAEACGLMAERIPDDLWAELDALAPEPELWLN
jgi:hypothetical protein